METRETLVGRERELGALTALLAGVGDHGAALVVCGGAGVGKSALLAATSVQARSQGMRLLTTTGVQAEAHLPFAGLHQVLRLLLDHADALPAPQRDALHAAFGVQVTSAPQSPAHNLGELSVRQRLGIQLE